MSCSSITPCARHFFTTTNGVPPFDEIAITACAISSGKLFRFQCNIFLLHPGTFSNIGSVFNNTAGSGFGSLLKLK
jgi:hypothetical protein